MNDRRRLGIGGSDIAAILNMDPYRNIVDVWREKTGRKASGEAEDKPWLDRGRRLEPVIADLFAERHPEYDLQRGIFRRSKRHTFMQGTPDRLIVRGSKAEAIARPDDPANRGILEIKHAGLHAFAKLKNEGLPSHWILQWQHYSIVTGLEWGHFAILNSERWELIDIEMQANPSLQDALVKLEADFWQHVQEDREPVVQVTDLPDMPEIGKQESIYQRDDEHWQEAMGRWREAKQLEAAAKQAMDEARADLTGAMGTGYGVYEGAEARAYWRQQAGRKTLDKRALIESKPIDPVALLAEINSLQGQEHWDLVLQDLIAQGKLEIDVSSFEKQGKPFETLKVYDLRKEA